jgi:hypothetical protein
MGTIRRLAAWAVCALLLGLAASALVRAHLPAIMSAMAPEMPQASPSGEPMKPDGGASSTVEGEEPEPEDMTPEGRPTSLSALSSGKGRPARAARSTSSRNSGHDTFSQELDRGIRRLAERRYEIKRSTLELALAHLGLLSRSVRVAPAIREGKPFGFRLFAVKADGPVAKLGLRNEDVLVSINGLDVGTADRALDAYNKLKTAGDLVLGLVREGREITQAYAIR